jgi:DNA-binding transcriptional LysR family regulator
MALNPRALDLFREVVRHNGMTRAAAALGIGQPFVTRAIARLEAEIGFALFARAHGGVTLTPEGEAFLREVERSRAGLDQLGRAAREIRERGTGMVRIACLPALTLGFLPHVLKRFMQAAPGVTVSLAVRSPDAVWSWVAAQQCDLGLARPKAGYVGVEHEPFLATPAVCAVPRGHRLAAKRAIAPKDLRGVPLIAAYPSAPHQSRVERAFADAGVAMTVVAEVQYTVPRCALAAQGLGVAIVDPVAAGGLGLAGVVLRRFVPAIPIETVMLFPANRPRSRLTHQLAELLREECRRAVRLS